MSNESLLSSLYFTKSTGNCRSTDMTFIDAVTVGEYPNKQKIEKIKSIEIFKSDRTDTAVIAGLAVTYIVDGLLKRVVHGIETSIVIAQGVVNIEANELLVGASGRLKDLKSDPTKDGRLSWIEFTVYNKDAGSTVVKGPFGSDKYLGAAWGTYGPIIALEGSSDERAGLTALGFTKLVQGVPGFGILKQ